MSSLFACLFWCCLGVWGCCFGVDGSGCSTAPRDLRTHKLRLLGPKTILYIRLLGYFDAQGAIALDSFGASLVILVVE